MRAPGRSSLGLAPGLPVDEDLLAFMRAADLTTEQAGVFARGLAWLGQREEALSRVPIGMDRDLVRRLLGESVDPGPWLGTPVPSVADGRRVDWIRLVATRTRSDRSTATVRVAGNPVTRIDLAQGGTVRFLAEGEVTVDGPGAVVERQGIPMDPEGATAALAMRLPRLPEGRVADGAWGGPSACAPV